MLENLSSKVTADGTAEAAEYDKFACFCKKTVDDKNYDIEQGTLKQNELNSTISVKMAEIRQLDIDIAALNTKVNSMEAELTSLRDQSSTRHKQYELDIADIKFALTALTRAIDNMRGRHSVESALMELRSFAPTLSKGLSKADALLSMRVNQLLVAAPAAPGLDYNAPKKHAYEYQSNDILETLNQLRDSFQKAERDMEAEESESAHQAALAEAAKVNEVAGVKAASAEKAETSARLTSEASKLSTDLSTVSANLKEDEDYMAQLVGQCEEKAKAWDKRSTLRANELSSISTALSVLKGKVQSLDAVNARPAQPAMLSTSTGKRSLVRQRDELAMFRVMDASPMSLIQKKSSPSSMESEAIDLLKHKAQELDSPALSALATRVADLSLHSDGPDAFAKVRTLIGNLISSLEQQQTDEATHSSWCDKEMKRVTDEKKEKEQKVQKLTGDVAADKTSADSYQQLAVQAQREIAELQAALSKQATLRASEAEKNTKAIADSKEGSEAVAAALQVLSEFYSKATSLVQTSQNPTPAIPEVFDSEYKGRQGDSKGVLGLLETIKSDFDRTKSSTESAEAAASAAYSAFTKSTKEAVDLKTKDYDFYVENKNAAVKQQEQDQADLALNEDLLAKANAELASLEPTCVGTGGNYEDRAARRKEEVEALKEALKIFEGTSFSTSLIAKPPIKKYFRKIVRHNA